MRGAWLLVVCVTLAAAYDVSPALNALCQEWVMKNQKNMIVNQVAESSRVETCAQFCLIAGAGFRTDTTTCRMLCENSGGYTEFSASLKLNNGAASPNEICNNLLSDKEDVTAAAKTTPVKSAVNFLQIPDVPKQRKLGIRGDLTVQGSLSTQVLTSPVGDVKVSGEINVMNSIEANTARTAFFKVDAGVAIRERIVSKRDQLIIKGRIDADSVTADSLQASFLEINGVRQWSLSSLEDFEEVGVDGWSHGEVTECGGHRILGGHCVEKGSAEVAKTFANLPPHTQVRVVAKYMFIDSWDGETGYLKVDSRPVWLESYNHREGDSAHGINICGNETPERKFGRTIDVVIPHTGSAVTLAFGATTDEHSCDESFGIDSVIIFTR